MTTLQQWEEAQANPEVVHNRNFETLSAAGIFAKKQSVTTALTWGYYGGLYNGNTVADGTVTLTNTADNYVVVLRSTGVVSASTSSTNSLDPLHCKLYKVTCAGGVVTAVVDQRFDANGLLFAGASVASTNTVTALSISLGVVNIDCSLGDYFTLTLTANVTSITFSNLPGSGKGASKWIEIVQGAGPYTVAWPASFKWAGGSVGSVSTANAAKDELAITTVDNGSDWKATLVKAWA